MAVLIFHSTKASYKKNFSLGFLSPWKSTDTAVDKRFGVSLWKKNTTVQEEPTPLINVIIAKLGNNPAKITLRGIYDLITFHPEILAPYLTIGTAISSASANVRRCSTPGTHALLLKRHNHWLQRLGSKVCSSSSLHQAHVLVTVASFLLSRSKQLD